MPLCLLIGWLLDLLLGDPAWLPHPVVAFGKWISFGEHRLNKGAHRKLKGALFALLSIALVFALTWLLLSIVHCSLSIIHYPLSILLIFFCLAGHTLRREVRDVFLALERSLDDGRRQVARIVGRDTSALSAQEVRTAALETLAENLSDGVVAPLFWFALLGVPGMVAYKMVNTLDSMIGYRTDRYREFGCWAARIDDVANYIPARLTALLILVSYKLLAFLRLVSKTAVPRILRFVCHYGPQHLSPNSGWPEAALAGCLDCRFGGTHDYFGKAVEKPFIGQNDRRLTLSDMRASLRVCFLAEVVAVAICALISFRIQGFCLM